MRGSRSGPVMMAGSACRDVIAALSRLWSTRCSGVPSTPTSITELWRVLRREPLQPAVCAIMPIAEPRAAFAFGQTEEGRLATSLHDICKALTAIAIGSALALANATSVRSEELETWRPVSVPELKLPALDGAVAELSSETGKLVIVHFFATWCEPCRDELTSLERLASAFAARPFQILAVDVGEPADRVRRFLERNKISVRYPVLVDFDKQVMRAWEVEMLPTSYVLDRALCPLWKVAGALEWDVGATLAKLEVEVARIERKEPGEGKEDCNVKGHRQ